MMSTHDSSDPSENELRQFDRTDVPAGLPSARSNLSGVKTVIAFASARGGSGKSVLAVNLAAAIAAKGRKVGILDADTDSPSVQAVLGMRRTRIFPTDGSIEAASGPLGLRVIAADMIVESVAVAPLFVSDDASPDIHPIALADEALGNGVAHRTSTGDFPDLLGRIFEECRFGNLDFLFIDLRSGIDSIRRIAQLRMPAALVMVTAPSQLAADSTRRAIDTARELRLPVWGLVENMVGFYCEHCRSVRPLIGEGDVSGLSREANAPILARLPFEPRLADTADRGILFVREHAHAPLAGQLIELAKRLEEIAAGAVTGPFPLASSASV
jgi:ATP-binding protein involved in chromosome partitioning